MLGSHSIRRHKPAYGSSNGASVREDIRATGFPIVEMEFLRFLTPHYWTASSARCRKICHALFFS